VSFLEIPSVYLGHEQQVEGAGTEFLEED
jgi:hypothetical protein